MRIEFQLNGESRGAEVEPLERLVDALRERFGAKSVKEGCGEGECGSCTVIVDGKAVASCMMLAAQVDGREVMTAEGLGKDGELDRLQDAFLRHGAVQCGYCTPGMLMSVKALLIANPKPNREDVVRAIEGNLCRCTGYHQIVEAVADVAGGFDAS